MSFLTPEQTVNVLRDAVREAWAEEGVELSEEDVWKHTRLLALSITNPNRVIPPDNDSREVE